jgi:hypothetical protein
MPITITGRVTIVQSNGPIVKLDAFREVGADPTTFNLNATESDKTGSGDGLLQKIATSSALSIGVMVL